MRGPKEECYLDPNKAPLSHGSKEIKGGRYFSRNKHRSTDPVKLDKDLSVSDIQGNDTLEKPSAVEQHLSSENRILSPRVQWQREARAPGSVHASKEILGKTLTSALGSTCPSGAGVRSAEDQNLHRISSGGIPSKSGLLVKKLLRRQLRRAVSFGAVEHVLQTLRGKDGSGSEEIFTRIIWDSQPHSRTRRRTCSGHIEGAKCMTSQREVNRSSCY